MRTLNKIAASSIVLSLFLALPVTAQGKSRSVRPSVAPAGAPCWIELPGQKDLVNVAALSRVYVEENRDGTVAVKALTIGNAWALNGTYKQQTAKELLEKIRAACAALPVE